MSSPLNNTNSSGDPTGIAGAPFNATINAVCENNSLTPNFSALTIISAQAPFEPAHGTMGILSNTDITAAMFADGSAEPESLSYSEVGNFTMKAESTDYLGSGMDISGSAVVGRFTPTTSNLRRVACPTALTTAAHPHPPSPIWGKTLNSTTN